MAIRIKNERIHAMAKELAALTGQSQVAAVAQALREKLRGIETEKRAAANRTTSYGWGRDLSEHRK